MRGQKVKNNLIATNEKAYTQVAFSATCRICGVSWALAFTVKLFFTFLRLGAVGVNNFICVYQVYDVYLYRTIKTTNYGKK